MFHRIGLFAIYVVLFAIAIPWYWPDPQLDEGIGNRPFILGLPVWFCVSILSSVVISMLTALTIRFAWKSSERGDDQAPLSDSLYDSTGSK